MDGAWKEANLADDGTVWYRKLTHGARTKQISTKQIATEQIWVHMVMGIA